MEDGQMTLGRKEIGECEKHGEFVKDAPDSPCPSCEDMDPSGDLSYEEVVSSLSRAMEALDGDEVAAVHNMVCGRQIRYLEDCIWEYTGKTA